jgi:hypothetical protein
MKIAKTEGAFVYIGGDGCDNFIQPSKISFEMLNQQGIIRQQGLFIRTLEKLQNKVVAMGTGNHSWEQQLTGIDRVSEVAKRLKIVYTDVGGLLKLKVGKVEYNIFRTHKYKSTSTVNLVHACKQCWRMGEYDADIIVIEHRHAAAFEPFYGHKELKIGIRTGTYKIYDNYARANGFYGLKVENPTVILYPNEKKMIPFLDMFDAFEYLKGIRKKKVSK